MRAGIDMSDDAELVKIVDTGGLVFSVDRDSTAVRIDGVDVSDDIRRPDVTANARHAASSPMVRARLVEMQRKIAAGHERIVTEGRDQGTVAFADADVKFYLTADPAERAGRRLAELEKAGKEQTFEQVRAAIEQRDSSDEGRAVGPLRPADDAVVVDTTDLSIQEVVEKLLEHVEEKCPERS